MLRALLPALSPLSSLSRRIRPASTRAFPCGTTTTTVSNGLFERRGPRRRPGLCAATAVDRRFDRLHPPCGRGSSRLFSAPASPNGSEDADDDRVESGCGQNEQPGGLPGYPSRLLARLATPSAKPSFLSDALPLRVAVRAGVSAFFGIGCLTALHYGPWLSDGWASGDITMVLGSFGATAVLVYGYPAAPFSQPKNVVLGHVLSAACGVAAHKYLVPVDLAPTFSALGELTLGLAPDLGPDASSGTPILAAPVAVSVATVGMMALGIVHPPAGGTCLIACMGSDAIHELGWQFLVPTAFGSTFLCTTAFFINNLSGDKSRRYPAEGWW